MERSNPVHASCTTLALLAGVSPGPRVSDDLLKQQRTCHLSSDDFPQPEGPKIRMDCLLDTWKESPRQIVSLRSGVNSVMSSLLRTKKAAFGQNIVGQGNKDKAGQDRTGLVRTGQVMQGRDMTGRDRTGNARPGHEGKGQDRTAIDQAKCTRTVSAHARM